MAKADGRRQYLFTEKPLGLSTGDVVAVEGEFLLYDNGAPGVLLKSAPTHELAGAIRKIAAGERVLSKEIRALVRETSCAPDLTERQLQILNLAVRGFTNQEIADQMQVALITVKKQFSDIFIRLGVANRSEVIGLGSF